MARLVACSFESRNILAFSRYSFANDDCPVTRNLSRQNANRRSGVSRAKLCRNGLSSFRGCGLFLLSWLFARFTSLGTWTDSARNSLTFLAGISRDHWHKRRATGGKRKPLRKKRKFELGRPAANTKLGPQRIHTVSFLSSSSCAPF